LIARDLATQGNASGQNGLHVQNSGVSETVAAGVLKLLFQLFASAPWHKQPTADLAGSYSVRFQKELFACFEERHAYKIDFKTGSRADSSVAQYFTVLGASDPASRGFVGGNSLASMREKYIKATTGAGESGEDEDDGDNEDAAAVKARNTALAATSGEPQYRCASCAREFKSGKVCGAAARAKWFCTVRKSARRVIGRARCTSRSAHDLQRQ